MIEGLSENQTDRIVGAGIELMAAITEAYGPEDGLKTWDQLADVLGEDIKHAIFLSMLMGRTSGVAIIPGHKGYRNSPGAKYVEFIKIIRRHTGMGLKEAKDYCDEIDAGLTKNLSIGFKERREFISELAEIGIIAQ